MAMWKLQCLLCEGEPDVQDIIAKAQEQGDYVDMLKGGLTLIQEHLMTVHDVDIRGGWRTVSPVVIDSDVLEWEEVHPNSQHRRYMRATKVEKPNAR